MADEEDIEEEADVELLRAHVRRFNAVLKELDECTCPLAKRTDGNRLCHDCVIRIANGKPLNKPNLKIVKGVK